MSIYGQATRYTNAQTHIYTLLEVLLASQAGVFVQSLAKKNGSNSDSMYRSFLSLMIVHSKEPIEFRFQISVSVTGSKCFIIDW